MLTLGRYLWWRSKISVLLNLLLSALYFWDNFNNWCTRSVGYKCLSGYDWSLDRGTLHCCCDRRLVVVPWQVIGCPKAGRRTMDDPSASDDHPKTGHRTAQTSDRRPSALTNQIWFPAEDWLTQRNACEKEHLGTWIMLCVKYVFVIIADYICTKTFPKKKKNYDWNNWKLPLNRQWTQWGCNTFQPTNFFLGVHCCSGHSCKSLFVLIWTPWYAAYIHYRCFISLQIIIKIQCFVPSHPSQVGIMKNPTG